MTGMETLKGQEGLELCVEHKALDLIMAAADDSDDDVPEAEQRRRAAGAAAGAWRPAQCD